MARLTQQVDLDLLELFETVYRTCNVTIAGQQLGLSQSAVSSGIARLREAYADPLFVRKQRGVQPTPLADKLIEPIRQIVASVRATLAIGTFVPEDARTTLRIGMTDMGERMFLPALISRLSRSAPNMSVETVSLPLDALFGALASGTIDAAMGFMPRMAKEIRRQTLFKERFVYLLNRDVLADRSRLTLPDIREAKHIIASPPGWEHGAALERVITGDPVRARIALKVQSFLSIAPIVAATDLFAIVPSNLATAVADHLGVRVLPAPVTLPVFDISLYWHQRANKDPANMWLRRELTALFQDAQHIG